MNNIIVAIDIGSTKVATMIGKILQDGRIQILGDGQVPCKAIKKFAFGDEDTIVNAIKESVKQAQKKAGIIVHSMYVNIQGVYLSYIKNEAEITFDVEDKQITKKDVYELIKSVSAIDVYEDEKIVDVIPIKYIINGDTEVNDPVGLHGKKLSVEADIVVGHNDMVSKICRFIQKAGYVVDGVIPEVMAQSKLLLEPKEMKETTLLMDVGGTLTEFSVCKGNNIIFNSTIPIGGEYLTSDVAKVFSITLSEAENIKRELKVTSRKCLDEEKDISAYNLSKGDTEILKGSLVVEVMEARVYEIYEKAREKIMESGFEDLTEIKSFVISGEGVTHLAGYDIIAEEIFNIKPREPQFFVETGYSPVYTLCYSIINYIASCLDTGRSFSMVSEDVKEVPATPRRRKRKSKLLRRFTRFLQEFFSLNSID